MQDIGGRFFGVAGAGERRLRPHHNHQAALKCPRCDSANTKFCYYNNYNLSQPRHLCKSCRRYWTRGGVLRNVPVGGGCRKTKRSSKTKPPSSSSPPPPHRHLHRAASNSSSETETSSLTNNAAAAVTPIEAVLAPPPASATSSAAVEGSKICHVISGGGEEAAVLFSDMGTFTNLLTSPNDVPFGFGNVNDVPFRETSKLEVQTTSSDPEGCLSVFGTKGNGEFGSLDWHPGGGDDDQGLFDLPNPVDHAYWSQAGQWNDQDPAHSFYLP